MPDVADENASLEDSRTTLVDTIERSMPESEADRSNIIETRYNSWWKNHDDRNDDNDRNDRNDAAPVITQESAQEVESGDVSQSFNVSNTGDNSNQCAGIQGVANTGNAQNQISIVQSGSEADDFEFEDVGSTINVSPSNSTSCDQQVNQDATAYYGGKW
jgi:hypothetical protein